MKDLKTRLLKKINYNKLIPKNNLIEKSKIMDENKSDEINETEEVVLSTETVTLTAAELAEQTRLAVEKIKLGKESQVEEIPAREPELVIVVPEPPAEETAPEVEPEPKQAKKVVPDVPDAEIPVTPSEEIPNPAPLAKNIDGIMILAIVVMGACILFIIYRFNKNN